MLSIIGAGVPECRAKRGKGLPQKLTRTEKSNKFLRLPVINHDARSPVEMLRIGILEGFNGLSALCFYPFLKPPDPIVGHG